MLKAFAIFDTKAGTFNTPFFMPATGMAVRAFADLVNDPQSSVSKHPDDYRLAYIGTFDPVSAALKAEAVAFLGTGVDFVNRSN